jgi:hypothetical protein
VGLTEGHRSIFEQSDLRALSTPKKGTTEMVDGTLGMVALEIVTKEK